LTSQGQLDSDVSSSNVHIVTMTAKRTALLNYLVAFVCKGAHTKYRDANIAERKRALAFFFRRRCLRWRMAFVPV